MSVAADWIVFDVSDDVIERAKQMRRERDEQYGNIFREASTDLRWVGEVGEILVSQWLGERIPERFDWILDETSGKPDFILFGSVNVGVKTVKRQAAPRADYTAQITAKHAHEPVADFLFCSYDFRAKKLYMLGGISKGDFLAGATYYREGEAVHGNYTIRRGHEIYNIEIDNLAAPEVWLTAHDASNSPTNERSDV